MTLQLTATLNGESRTWAIETSPTRIGRSSSNTIQLLDGTVSKEHAEITRDGERWLIRDLGSRNGTRVNGEDANQPRPIKSGDWIEVGHVGMRAGLDALATQWVASETSGSSVKIKVEDILQRPTAAGRDTGRLVRLLAEAGQMLVMPRPLRETCEEILTFVERALSSNRLVVLLRNPDGTSLDQIAARTRGASARDPLALSKTIVKVVLEENTAVITGDAMNDPRFAQAQSIVGQLIHSAMAVPLYDNETVLGILYADSTSPAVIYEPQDLELLTLLANMAAVKISNARLLEAEQARLRMAQELATATRIQQTLLPAAPKDIAGWSCHARLESCYEVGGDLYDFHRRADGVVTFVLGDVSGKGMGAALMMSSAMSSSRVLYDACDEPLAFIQRLNDVMIRSTDARSFLTVFVGYLEPATGRLRYVNAGHPEPYLVRGGQLRSLPATGIPVAMLPTFPWSQGETVIEPGETLVVFSDGIPEAQHGKDFFENERIEAALRELSGKPGLDEVAEGMIARIDAFAAGEHRADDVTIVLVRRDGAGAAA